jgi:type I restriction enzyme S subunit
LKTQKLEELNMAGGVPSLTQTVLNKLRFPVTTINEQERIVHLLDQFDEATKRIVAQLEKEIELRNKQYEYYRNLLLNFTKD